MKKRILCMIFVFLFCLLPLTGCKKSTSDTDTAPRDYGTWRYGNYIYFSNNSYALPLKATTCQLARYHVTTGRVSAACTDAKCDHGEESNCPFLGFVKLEYIVDNTIYYTIFKDREGTYGQDTYLMAYDIKKEKASVVMNCSEWEVDSRFQLADGVIYFVQVCAKEDVHPESAEDYTYALCRFVIGKKDYEKLFDIPVTYRIVGMSTERTELIWVANDTCYFLDGATGNIYATDMTGKTLQWVTNSEFPYSLDLYSRYGNRVYFFGGREGAASTYEYTYPADPSKGVNQSYTYEYSRAQLYALDLENNTFQPVLDNMADYAIADGKIYYTTWGFRFYGYDDYGAPIHNMTESEIYCCDLDGSNAEVVYTNFNLLGGNFAVVNSKLFGIFCEYSEEGCTKNRYGVLNLKNGKLTYFDTIEKYI